MNGEKSMTTWVILHLRNSTACSFWGQVQSQEHSFTLTVSIGKTIVPAMAAELPPRTTLSHRAKGRAGLFGIIRRHGKVMFLSGARKGGR